MSQIVESPAQLEPLEKKVIQALDSLELRGSSLLLAVSGGLDSMVMATALCRLHCLLRLNLGVAYIHHGPAETPVGDQYRLKAFAVVRDWAQQRGVNFYSNFTGELAEGEPLVGESGLRDFRYNQLFKILQSSGLQKLVVAHHFEDLLETRLIRLIRGTGPEGLFSMGEGGGDLVRPLLRCSRKALEDYGEKRGVLFVEDPSNQEREPLRNWLRYEWLPLLEEKRQGATESFARSLEQIVQGIQGRESSDGVISEGKILKMPYLTLSSREKCQIIAKYLRDKGAKNYSTGQVSEVVKRLQRQEQSFEFTCAGAKWSVDAKHVIAMIQSNP